MPSPNGNGASGDSPVEEKAGKQTGQKKIRLRLDERNMESTYANAFRTHGTAEEVMLDFGINQISPASQQDQPEIIFQVNDRVILNYFVAKRLAITLSTLIRRHEDDFGELELDVNKRRKSSS